MNRSTTDTILGGRVHLFQPKDGYRVAIDPVLLAAAVDVPSGSRVLDAGCGVGAALLCALTRLTTAKGVGLEREPEMVKHAQQAIVSNALEARANIITGDLARPPSTLGEPFDAVITNPPFYASGSIPARGDATHAHTESNLPLAGWVKACLKRLRPEGLFAIIHRAERVAEIVAALDGKAGALTLYPLWPKAGQPAKRVIVTACKGRRSPATVHPGLVLHTDSGDFTPAAQAILRDGAPIETTA